MAILERKAKKGNVLTREGLGSQAFLIEGLDWASYFGLDDNQEEGLGPGSGA